RHTPPIMSWRSTIATPRPSLAAAIAAVWPPGPEPITSRSKSCTFISVTVKGGVVEPWAFPRFIPSGWPAPAARGPGPGRWPDARNSPPAPLGASVQQIFHGGGAGLAPGVEAPADTAVRRCEQPRGQVPAVDVLQ